MTCATDRQSAAAHLHEARALVRDGAPQDGEHAAEAVAWARCAWPESVAARRLEIRLALDHGHTDFADSLIAQGLLLRPNDRALRRFYAERLIERGRLNEARVLLDELLREQPMHTRVLLLAAKVAGLTGQPLKRIDLLERIALQRPADMDVHRELIDAFLAAEKLDDAERLIGLCQPPSPELEARWLIAKGRLHDAAARLEQAERDRTMDERAAMLLIELLEDLGDAVRLRACLDRITAHQPQALLRAARARLSLGDFDRVQRDLAGIFNTTADRQEAASLLTAASWATGRFDAARTWLARAREEGGGEPMRFAEIWRRTLWGRLRGIHTHPHRAGADPEASPINRLLRSALHVFSEDARNSPDDDEARLLLDQARSLLGGTDRPAATTAAA